MLIYGFGKDKQAAIDRAQKETLNGGRLAATQCTVTGNCVVESLRIGEIPKKAIVLAVFENGREVSK